MTHRFHALAVPALWLLGMYCLAGPVLAAETRDDRVTALEEKLDRSFKLIEQLSARVKELEAQRAGTALPAQAAPPARSAVAAESVPQAQAQAQAQTQARLESVEQQLTQLTDASAARGGGGAGVPLHGFFDVGIGNHTANEPGLKGANMGALDIFLNPQLGEHTRSLFELTFEVNEHGGVDADLERGQLGYQFSDAATVWIGRFHTPFP